MRQRTFLRVWLARVSAPHFLRVAQLSRFKRRLRGLGREWATVPFEASRKPQAPIMNALLPSCTFSGVRIRVVAG